MCFSVCTHCCKDILWRDCSDQANVNCILNGLMNGVLDCKQNISKQHFIFKIECNAWNWKHKPSCIYNKNGTFIMHALHSALCTVHNKRYNTVCNELLYSMGDGVKIAIYWSFENTAEKRLQHINVVCVCVSFEENEATISRCKQKKRTLWRRRKTDIYIKYMRYFIIWSALCIRQ